DLGAGPGLDPRDDLLGGLLAGGREDVRGVVDADARLRRWEGRAGGSGERGRGEKRPEREHADQRDAEGPATGPRADLDHAGKPTRQPSPAADPRRRASTSSPAAPRTTCGGRGRPL